MVLMDVLQNTLSFVGLIGALVATLLLYTAMKFGSDFLLSVIGLKIDFSFFPLKTFAI